MSDTVTMGKAHLLIREDANLNCETPVSLLDSPLTPATDFFVRNNGTLPHCDEALRDDWGLSVDGEVERALNLTVRELKANFPAVTLTAVLECAGNGRALLDPQTDGLPWRHGAVGCARWTGVRLGDVLLAAGLRSSAVYSAHESPDRQREAPEKAAFSRGLPIAKALSEECLIAFAMNDEPLPVLHGGPLRIVAPGYPGAAWQKWLSRIWVRDREHDGPKMTGLDYRLNGKVIAEMPVKSLITAPLDGFSASVGEAVEVRGFAWSGDVPVASVAISADGGESWLDAALEPAPGRFAWHRFRKTVKWGQTGPVRLAARATDRGGNQQPIQGPWNPKGYCNNQIHVISGTIR